MVVGGGGGGQRSVEQVSQSQEFPGKYFTVAVFSLSDICLS